MRVMEPPRGIVLAIAAHPDDIESWCAGTLARAVANGATISLVLVTSGEAGSADAQDTRATVKRRREAEALTAAQILGIADVIFLCYPDGEVANMLDLRAALVTLLRQLQPDVVFTHDPENPTPPYLSHPDHRAVGRAVLDAAYPLARDRLALPTFPAVTVLPPHAVSAIWLFASDQADTAVDISATFDAKVEARLAHMSQTSDPVALRLGWQERAERLGALVGLPMAETFTVLPL